MFSLTLLLFINLSIFNSLQEKICKTPERRKIAERYLKHLNDSVNPCDNFYHFVCGNYQENHEVSENQDKISVFQEMQKTIDLELLEILKNNESGGVFLKAHYYFDSCIDGLSRKLYRDALLKEQISNFGGWNLLNENVENSQWESIAGKLFGHGFQAMMNIKITPSFENSQKYTLMLDDPSVFLKDAQIYTKKSPILANYRNLINSTLAFLGINNQKIIDDILEVEKSLAKISGGDGLEYGAKYTYKKIKEKVPSMNWDLFFRESGLNITDTTTFTIIAPGYLPKLEKILQVYSKNPEKIVNYLMWVLVVESVKYMGEKWYKPLNDFERQTKGFYTNYSSWQFCVSESRKKFGNVLAAEIFSKQNKYNDSYLIENLISNLKSSMRSIINEAEWMDIKTRSIAVEKLEVMKIKIGYSGEDESKAYNSIYTYRNEFLKNEIKLKKIEQIKKFQLIGQPTDTFWKNPLEVNPISYHPNLNELQIQTAISRFPMLIPGLPSSILYGSFGSLISHEISHAADTKSSSFDKNGNLKLWWGLADFDNILEKSKCFEKQYNTGTTTLTEDIADNGAIRIAYEAYKKLSVEENSKLPGLEKYTDDQLFFLAYGNNFCTSYKESTMAHISKSDEYSLGQKRVNIPLQNFEKFSEVFNCKIGDPMVLKDKCRVW